MLHVILAAPISPLPSPRVPTRNWCMCCALADDVTTVHVECHAMTTNVRAHWYLGRATPIPTAGDVLVSHVCTVVPMYMCVVELFFVSFLNTNVGTYESW
jgi:hypothetical protein